jgi:hypothetical protein
MVPNDDHHLLRREFHLQFSRSHKHGHPYGPGDLQWERPVYIIVRNQHLHIVSKIIAPTIGKLPTILTIEGAKQLAQIAGAAARGFLGA